MRIFCHFDTLLPSNPVSCKRAAIIFTASQQFGKKAASEELKSIFADALVPHRTIFVCLEDNRNDVSRLLKSDELNHLHLPFDPQKAEIYYFSRSGILLDSRRKNTRIDSLEANLIRRQGMTSIFLAGGGLMKSGQSYHYVKPSGGHSNYFLRPGNIMKNGPDVAFISCWLLAKINEFTPAIYSDTASITQIAYSLAEISQRLRITKTNLPVQSFSSYEGVEATDAFAPEHDALVIISASTSGSLRKQIIRSGASPENVITLFSTNNDSDCLCNLANHKTENPAGISPFKTSPRSHCSDCAGGSLAITIAGDSFLPETPEPRLKLLKRTDRPKWLSKVLTSLESNELIRCFRPLGEGKNAPVYVDLRKICKSFSKNDNFSIPLSRITPIDIDAIIYLDDPASHELAKGAHDKFKDKSNPPELICANSKLDENLDILQKKKGESISVSVFASCISGGFSLLAVSRALRKTANQISYFIGLVLQPNQQSWEELKSNLELRNDERGRNPIEVVWNAEFPRSGATDISSWDLELRWLAENEHYLEDSNPLHERIKLLQNTNSERTDGLIDNVFLKSPQGNDLVLAPNFAFHRIKNADKKLSQADVFFIVCSILHGLRESGDINGLRQSLNGPVLLSPTNFDRYNDSLLQAALLRAARPSEIAYTTHPTSSRHISDLIIRMISDRSSSENEALPEFLLALGSGRMTLASDDAKHILRAFEKHLENCPYLGVFGPSIYTAAIKE